MITGQSSDMARERVAKAFRLQPYTLLVAIHVTPTDRWQLDIDLARTEGADGIILIRDYNTLATDDDTMAAYTYARHRYPHWWIGINLLGHRPHEAILRAQLDTSGLWFDDALVNAHLPNSAEYIARVWKKSQTLYLPRPPLFIQSVAMKYHRPDENITAATALLEPFADIIVTSGTKTGEAPDLKKVRELRIATGLPIGICSGISSENVERFLDVGAEVFIVNTSISTNGRLDPAKLRSLRSKIPQH